MCNSCAVPKDTDITTCCCRRSLPKDGYLKDVPESRWSCAEEKESADGITECYIDFDLNQPYTLLRLVVCEWFEHGGRYPQ